MSISEIRKRLEAATEGPWSLSEIKIDGLARVVESGPGMICGTLHGNDDANGEFLAHSWQDIKTLLDLIGRMNVAMRETLDFAPPPICCTTKNRDRFLAAKEAGYAILKELEQ